MVSTRSKSAPKQATLEETIERKEPDSKKRKTAKPATADETNKQKAPPSGSKPSKKVKADTSSTDEAIIINRAPVLHLWAASVAHFVHPKLSWETCLSAGSAISTITAIAKGRSIGTIEPKDPEKKKEAKHDDDAEVVEVMQFKLHVKDGRAMVGSSDKTGKPGNEGALKSKFGDDNYERVRKAFDACLQSWKGDEDKLNEQAFGFYEDFRPTVAAGQKGWGRKGELNLDTVQQAVKKDS